ncbi:DNA-processing protein DprA [Mycolicibacterium palauense]|uniref:DNA-processing protein DprA n=1 Tax=Mycolicibacterium palauense TaxID=2034511 RepID=UPI000BFF1576|nr:DNA-processing protein DprA [Mycolicibacterium palauense]
MTAGSARRREAWAYLARVAEPPCPQLAAFVAAEGPEDAARRIRADDVPEPLGPLVQARRHIDRADRDLEILDRRGGRLITPDDPEWPHLAFRAFVAGESPPKPGRYPPMVLWACGPARLDEIAERSAAIVGTRAATSYGEHMAADLASGLVEEDVAVVSGGAYGIDGAAHRAALAADGVTVAVLAGGVDVAYPAGHSALLHRIARTGLLLTEYPPEVRPARYRFLTRNRLVAAVAGATVVVEAGLRSGAANTASWAESLGRVVAAVPGPVTSAASAGCHQLMRGNAVVVTRAAEIIEIVGRSGELADEPAHPSGPLDGLTEAEQRVYEALPARGLSSVSEIAASSGLPAQRVLGPLALLEVAGRIEQEDGRWRLPRRRARPGAGDR